MEPEVITLSCKVDMDRFISDFTDVKRFLACCGECPSFGRTWACPPYDFDPMNVWRSYKSILIYARKVTVPVEMRSRTYSKEELSRVMEELIAPVKKALEDELRGMEKAEPGSLALSAGGCDHCEVCMRGKGLPCVKPELMRCSVESLGGNVVKCITELLEEKVVWAENGSLPEHFILLGGLLQK